MELNRCKSRVKRQLEYGCVMKELSVLLREVRGESGLDDELCKLY
jgi:hypothetical protein